jgi:hypothetical protein
VLAGAAADVGLVSALHRVKKRRWQPRNPPYRGLRAAQYSHRSSTDLSTAESHVTEPERRVSPTPFHSCGGLWHLGFSLQKRVICSVLAGWYARRSRIHEWRGWQQG